MFERFKKDLINIKSPKANTAKVEVNKCKKNYMDVNY